MILPFISPHYYRGKFDWLSIDFCTEVEEKKMFCLVITFIYLCHLQHLISWLHIMLKAKKITHRFWFMFFIHEWPLPHASTSIKWMNEGNSLKWVLKAFFFQSTHIHVFYCLILNQKLSIIFCQIWTTNWLYTFRQNNGKGNDGGRLKFMCNFCRCNI